MWPQGMQASRFSSVKQRTQGLDGVTFIDSLVLVVSLVLFVTCCFPVGAVLVGESREDRDDIDSFVND